MFTDWERSSRLLVAKFRADSARHLGDPEFESLIAALRKSSPEFCRAWKLHEVAHSGEGRKDLMHPVAGMLSFSHAVFHPAEESEQRLVLYSPLPENETAEKLARLMSGRPEPAAAARRACRGRRSSLAGASAGRAHSRGAETPRARGARERMVAPASDTGGRRWGSGTKSSPPATTASWPASERDTFAAHRRALLAGATGDVIEIGGGTGANLQMYDGALRSLTVTEPEEPMVVRLQRKIDEQRPGTKLVRASAEELPFEDDSFDTAVSTLVLCTVADQPRALSELRRVLRPGGRLLFIEHVRADDERLARWQDRLQPMQGWLACGCHCNRPTLDGIRSAGFEVTRLEHDTIAHAPPIVRPLIVGVATA